MIAAVPGASAAPGCDEAPETVGSEIIGTPCDDVIRMPRNITTSSAKAGTTRSTASGGTTACSAAKGMTACMEGSATIACAAGPETIGSRAGSAPTPSTAKPEMTSPAVTQRSTGSGTPEAAPTPSASRPGRRRASPTRNRSSTMPVFRPMSDGGLRRPRRRLRKRRARALRRRRRRTAGTGERLLGFETVIGTPFDDYIVGTSGAETLYGGGGADLIEGGGGERCRLRGRRGRRVRRRRLSHECESTSAVVDPRDPGTVSSG